MLRDRILALLNYNTGLTDREITDRLSGHEASQQPINQTCRRLEKSGLIERKPRPDGLIGNYLLGAGIREAEKEETVRADALRDSGEEAVSAVDEEGRQDTKLEAEGAEFLVLGNLLIQGVSCFKAYTRFRGYDLIAVNPDTGRSARIQVKSRWATDYDRSFPIKNFDCDFVVLVALNRGYRFRRKPTPEDSGKLPPQFYVFPAEVVKTAQNRGDKWGKVTITNIPDHASYADNWGLIVQFLGGREQP